MLRTINFYNPIFNKTSKFKSGLSAYPKNEHNIANYIIHSESLLKMFTFILYDFTSDEFRLTDRFCVENSFKKLQKTHMKKNKLFEMKEANGKLSISIDTYIFTYINSLNTMNTNNDIHLVSMEAHFKNIMKQGLITKKSIVTDHFTVK